MPRDLLGKVLGIGSGGGSLQKLRIDYDDRWHRNYYVEALFNPSEIRRSRSVTWEQEHRPQQVKRWGWDDIEQTFVGVEPETLSVSLFFDTYEARDTGGSSLKKQALAFVNTANPFASGDSTDVTRETDPVVRLAEVDVEMHRPPICELSWGAYPSIFTGVLTQLEQTFTMFLTDGTPVRATLDCTFTEFETRAHAKAKELHSADVVKTRVVARGDTLHSLAAQEYNDPSLWRHIARANGIVNPRSVLPGTVLTIPKLVG
jgi:Contractile injection system tube protein/LysM domain